MQCVLHVFSLFYAIFFLVASVFSKYVLGNQGVLEQDDRKYVFFKVLFYVMLFPVFSFLSTLAFLSCGHFCLYGILGFDMAYHFFITSRILAFNLSICSISSFYSKLFA